MRDDLAEADRAGGPVLLAALVDLYDRARPEDWISQLVEVNRQMAEEVRQLQALTGSAAASRQTA
jgi:hypothetical protein